MSRVVDVIRSERARRFAGVGLVAAAAIFGLVIALRIAHDGMDYETQAGPTIDDLVRGDLHQVVTSFPVIGPLTIALRAPFVALVFESDVRVVYLIGVAVCIVPLIAYVLWLGRRLQSSGRKYAVAPLFLIALANPLTFRVIHWGHPEDFVMSVGICAAAIALMDEKVRLAAVFFGLAVAAKQTAILAGPVLLAVARPRCLTFFVIAAVIAVLAYLPLAIGNFHHFTRVMAATSNPTAFYVSESKSLTPRDPHPVPEGMTRDTPLNVWWPFAKVRYDRVFGRLVRSGVVSDAVVSIGHALAVVVALLVGLLALRHKAFARRDILLMLAFVFLTRSLLDPLDFDYHHFTFFLCLLSWEALRGRGVPVVSAVVALIFGVLAFGAPDFAAVYRHSFPYSVLYLVTMIPLALVIGRAVVAGDRMWEHTFVNGLLRGRQSLAADRSVGWATR